MQRLLIYLASVSDNNFALYIINNLLRRAAYDVAVLFRGSAAILNDEQAQQLVAKIDAERMRISGSQGQYVLSLSTILVQ